MIIWAAPLHKQPYQPTKYVPKNCSQRLSAMIPIKKIQDFQKLRDLLKIYFGRHKPYNIQVDLIQAQEE